MLAQFYDVEQWLLQVSAISASPLEKSSFAKQSIINPNHNIRTPYTCSIPPHIIIMHFVRRAAARAASSASSSLISQSRAINTSSPSFLLRSKFQATSIAPSAFRKYSNDVAPAADNEQSAVKQATESAFGDEGSDFGENPSAYGERAPREQQDRSSFDRGGYRGGRDDRRQAAPRPPRDDLTLEPTDTVYVGNLLFEVTGADLEREFGEFGTVKSATIATDARQLSKGFGYVQFENVEQAKAAIEAKHETQFEGRRMIVNYMAKRTNTGARNPPAKTLFIGNLAFEMSDKDLNNLFRDVRNVVDVRVAIDRRTGQPRGFAHADFTDMESAVKGFEALNGKEVYGRTLRLDYSSDAREPRRPRSDSGEGRY
ncbi:RNA-binding, RBD [Glarea lozoyensis ATCC 20868]|uniref:RNA-binding, RBD n=1 Tax=Glarea lozoyensis (strain ATCC 20868 / MF5171) TaxID=1116229 RepID=S3DF49_GLAL2|nr:RNA-binding, RBD [Glarea lozoyensis ATCC 20868]EPE36370.1 RNA-binding, RBD [Glarea lozoyensis ATCC 20868]